MSYEIREQRDLLNSRIVALFFESVLFGIFAVTYTIGTWSLLRMRRDPPQGFARRNWIALGVSSLMLILSFIHLCLTIQTTVHGFVTNGDTRETTYATLWNANNLRTSVDAGRFYLYVTQTLIGNAVIIYRLFIIWEGRWIVAIVPAVFFMVDVVGGYGSSASRTALPIIFFVFSFLTNAASSALIMWRVLRTYHRGDDCEEWDWKARAKLNLVRYRPVFEAILQCASVYCAASLVLIITFLASPEVAYYVCMSIFPPLLGFVFALIVLQIGRNSVTADGGAHVQLASQVSWRASRFAESRKGSVDSGVSRRTSVDSDDGLLVAKSADANV